MNCHRLLGVAAVIVAVIATVSSASAQQENKATKKKAKAVNPSLVPVEEQSGLPRVLLIGDSISMGYTIPVRDLLKGKANVVRPLANCGPTTRGVESLDSWLGDKKWDVIHFNWGLHDLVYFAADGKTRAEPTATGARPQVPLDQYEKHLRQLVRVKQLTTALVDQPQGASPGWSPGTGTNRG